MKKILVLSFVVFVALSCKSGYDGDPVQHPISVDELVSISHADLSPTGGEVSFTVSASDSWLINSDFEWLKFSKNSGKKGTTLVTMSADINTEGKDRDITFYVETTKGFIKIPITVTQPCPYLCVDVDSLSFLWNQSRIEKEGVPGTAETKVVSISSNIDWKIEEIATKADNFVDITHFTLDSLGGHGDNKMNFIPTKVNYYKEPYDVQVRLLPLMPDGKVIGQSIVNQPIIKLHQENLRFLLDGSPDDKTVVFNELNDDTNIKIVIDAEVPWKVQSCPSWVNLDKKEGSGVVIVNFLADGANPTVERRTGNIRLGTEAGAYRDIAVSQDPYVFEVTETEHLDFKNEDASVKKFTIKTTGTWEIQNIPAWLEVSPTSCTKTYHETGISEYQVSVKAPSQNFKLDGLAAALNVKSTMNDLVRSVSTSQERFKFDLTPSSYLKNLATMDTGKYPVNLDISGGWEMSDIGDWVAVSQTSSDVKGEYSIDVNAKTGNPDVNKDRSVVVTISSLKHRERGETVTKTFEIVQRRYLFEVDFSGIPNNVPAYKKQNVFSAVIKCSSNWEIIECPSWLKPSEISGDGREDKTINFAMESNKDRTSRSGSIIVESKFNGKKQTHNVRQDEFVFDQSPKSFNVKVINNETFSVPFGLTSEVPWTLTPSSSWISPSVLSGEGGSTISFKPSSNPELAERTATAVIKNSLTQETKTVTFIQEKFEFDFTPVSLEFDEIDKKYYAVDILSSGEWKIQDKPSWVVAPSSGQLSEEITIGVQNNIGTTERQADMRIVSTLGGHTKKVMVKQAAYVFDTTPVKFHYGTMETRADNVAVRSSGRWEVKNLPEWMSADKMSGKGAIGGVEEIVKFESTPNLSENERSAVIRIESLDNSSLEKTINVSQDKFTFNLSKNSHKFESSSSSSCSPANIDVKCTEGDWEIDCDAAWLKISPTSGAGDGSFAINVISDNNSGKDRESVITVTSSVSNLKRTIKIVQPGKTE